MNYYQHHIGDFNNATRHLTRVERALYRDLIELYYDKEQPLTSDTKKLARLILAREESELNALNIVLEDFFTLEDDGYHNSRCDAELEKYHSNSSAKARAGKASAEARRKKKEQQKEQVSTDVKQALNSVETKAQQTATNQEPITNNHKPIREREKEKKKKEIALPDNFEITKEMKDWFLGQKFSIDMVERTEAWKDAMQSNGKKYIDWKAGWRTGMRNAQKWYNQDNPQQPPPTSRQPMQPISEANK